MRIPIEGETRRTDPIVFRVGWGTIVIIYIEEERAYLHWVTHHRTGFVLDVRYKVAHPRPIIHRATCPEIRSSKTKHTHWTTGPHLKACALVREELSQWAKEGLKSESEFCPRCQPDHSAEHVPEAENLAGAHLTRLGSDIVSYVLDVAIVHLDEGDPDYLLTVGNLAQCMGKSSAQLAEPLARLIRDGYITISEPIVSGETPRSRSIIYPTPGALRTLPVYADLTEAEVTTELDKLHH